MSEASESMTRKVEAAFRKAAETVLREALRTGTPIIVWENGKIVELDAKAVQAAVLKKQADEAQGAVEDTHGS